MTAERVRRSTRVRKPVKSYAAEQAEDDDDAALLVPSKKRKKNKSAEDDYDAEEAQVETTKPTKKSKKKSIDPELEAAIVAMGWVKHGWFVLVESNAEPSTGASDNNWHADAAERRIKSTKSEVPKFAPGQKETRLRPYVEDPPQSYYNSLKRANEDRMYVLDRERGVEEDCHANHDSCPYETIQIAGSKGNVYTVEITHMPSCTCPAGLFKKGGKETLCKHALYILQNVFKAPEHLMQQNAFLTSELREIFSKAPALPAQNAEDDLGDGKRKSVEGDCPICFIEFEDDEETVWCRAACGNNVHKACFDQWAKTKQYHVTCPFCRSVWEYEAPKKHKVDVATVTMPTERSKGGYRNVKDQLNYD